MESHDLEATRIAPATDARDAGGAAVADRSTPAIAGALLELLLDTTTAGVAVVDPALRFVRVNGRMAELNRRPPAEHVGRTLREVLPTAADALEPLFETVLRTGHAVLNVRLGGANPHLPGVVRHFRASYHPLRQDGAVVAVVAVVHEVTDQVRAEEELREQETLFHLLVESVDAGFTVVHAETGRVRYASPAYARIFGRTAAALEDDPLAWLAAVHPDDREAVEARLRAGPEAALALDYRVVKPDGTVRRVHDRRFPVRRDDGRVAWQAGLAEDVTESRRTDDAQRLLAELGGVLSASLDDRATLRHAARVVAPALGGLCVVVGRNAEGAYRVVAAAHADPAQDATMGDLADAFRPDPANRASPVARAIREGVPVAFAPTEAEAREIARGDARLLTLRERYGLRVGMALPLTVRGATIGALVCARSGPAYDDEALALGAALAARIALAMDNALLFEAEQRARQAAEDAARRTAALQALTAAFSHARTAEEVAALAVRDVARLLGADGAILYRLLDEGTAERTIIDGLASEVVRERSRLALDPELPLTRVIRTGESIFVASREEFEARFPGVPARYPMGVVEAFLCVPLRGDEQTSGALVLSYGAPRALTDEDRALAVALAQQCGQALERVRLAEAEREARARADEERRRSAFLAEASRLLANSLDYEATLRAVARIAVPDLGDWCAVDMLESPEGEWPPTVRRLAVEHVDPEKVRWARELETRAPPNWDAPGGLPRVLRTGESEFYPAIDDALLVASARSEEELALLREIGFSAYLCVPMVARGRTLGALTLVHTDSRRHYRPDDLELARELAGRAAVAVDNARLYAAEQAARAAAESANRAKTEFLAVMSHELRTPLNAIAGYVELLQLGIRGAVTDAQRDDLERIRRSQLHLLGLINDVLNFARLDAGHVEYRIGPVAVEDALREVEALVAPQMMERGIRYACGRPPAGAAVRADAEKVRQILLNLLSNAVKFTPPGGRVTLDAGVEGDAVAIHVADTGVGIPPDRRDAIFEPFVQLGRSLASAHEGTGLGLAISRDLARGMGGDLRVESEEGRGSTFTLLLPRASGAEDGAPAPDADAA